MNANRSLHVIIPARYASTRLPGKPLLDIAGKPMIQHVYERVVAAGISSVTVATDDERIRATCIAFGAPVCMTAAHHQSGTERLAEAVQQLGIGAEEIVVNVQGDEPLLPATLIGRVADALVGQPQAVMATACCPLREAAEYQAPNVVKVVCDKNGLALYFTRAAVPYGRDSADGWRQAWRHIGIYAYRAGFIARYPTLEPSILEQIEQLEQLRVLWHGGRIAVCQVSPAEAQSLSVDTPADLEAVRRRVRATMGGQP